MKRVGEDDSVAWIGYADFLTTVAILFLVLFAITAAAQRIGTAVVDGRMEGSEQTDFSECVVRLGTAQELRAEPSGSFVLEVPGLSGATSVRVDARCAGVLEADTTIRLHPQDTTHLLLRLTKHPLSIKIDSLFERITILEDTVRILTEGPPLCERVNVPRSTVTELTVVGLHAYRFGADTLSLAELAARVRPDSARAAEHRCVHPLRVGYIRTLSAYDWQTSRAAVAALRYRTTVIGHLDR